MPAGWPALMFTYPRRAACSRKASKDICAIVHEHGGQVYLDGANLNALVGWPARATSAPTSAT